MTDTQDLIVRLREGLNGWLKSPMLTKAADALEAAQAEIERLEKLSVTNIMLAVVPGDGSGLEVYAQSVADVEQKLGDIGSELEDWQLGIKRYPAFQEIVDQRAAALARLAEIEATHTDEVINGLMLEKSLANLQTQEPVGTVDRTAPGFIAWAGIPKLKDGAKLYAAAGASNVQETNDATFGAILYAFVRMSLVNPSEAQLHQLDRLIAFYGDQKFASQLKLLAHQARTPHVNRDIGRARPLVFSGSAGIGTKP